MRSRSGLQDELVYEDLCFVAYVCLQSSRSGYHQLHYRHSEREYASSVCGTGSRWRAITSIQHDDIALGRRALSKFCISGEGLGVRRIGSWSARLGLFQ
jgi:hypothetical protein